MTIIEKIVGLIKKKYSFFLVIDTKSLKLSKFYPFIFISFLVFFSILFFMSSNLIEKKNKDNINSVKEITNTSEFSNLANFLISKINSPYEEVKYIIKNNDTVEKILRKFKVKDNEIKKVSMLLKQKSPA